MIPAANLCYRTKNLIKAIFHQHHFISTSFIMANNEIEKAKEAALNKKYGGEPTLFDKIISKQIPADIIYEDEKCLAFNDISPQAPVHFLIIPKYRIPMLEDSNQSDKEILGHMMVVAGKLGKEKAPKGFRLVVNDGVQGCQSVFHLHLHILGGRQMDWPPG